MKFQLQNQPPPVQVEPLQLPTLSASTLSAIDSEAGVAVESRTGSMGAKPGATRGE